MIVPESDIRRAPDTAVALDVTGLSLSVLIGDVILGAVWDVIFLNVFPDIRVRPYSQRRAVPKGILSQMGTAGAD